MTTKEELLEEFREFYENQTEITIVEKFESIFTKYTEPIINQYLKDNDGFNIPLPIYLNMVEETPNQILNEITQEITNIPFWFMYAPLQETTTSFKILGKALKTVLENRF